MKSGQYIKILMKEKKITGIYIAKKLGISHTTFSNKINGHRIFKEREITILLKILDMSYEEVFNKKQIPIVGNNQISITIDNESYTIDRNLKKKLVKYINKLEKEEI